MLNVHFWEHTSNFKHKRNTYNTSLKSPNTYICLKLSIAITGQSAGVFCICRRGCLNLSQSACKKFIVPLKETILRCRLEFTHSHKIMSSQERTCLKIISNILEWYMSKTNFNIIMCNIKRGRVFALKTRELNFFRSYMNSVQIGT